MTDFTALRSRWLHALSCEGSGLDQRTESLMALMQGAESSSGPDAGSLAASMASLLRQRSLLKDPGCDPLHQLFIEYVFSRCDAENKSHLALSCATLYPVAVQICVDSIGEAAAAPACRSAGLAASCSLALRLLTRILDLTQSAAPGRLIFMQAAAAIGAVDSLVALLQSILPVAARLGATHHGNVCGAEPCTHCSEEQAELAKISVLKCFAASLRATAVVGAGSLDASAVAVLLSASTVVRPPVLGDVLAALASVVSGDELCTQADMDAGEDIRYSLSAAAPPPRGVCPGMPTSFAFVSSGERSVATLTRKLKRFPVVATTVSDVSGASTTTWVTETVGAQAWSPLLSLFSAGVWFKANEECRGTTCVLFSIKNDFEEFSVMLKEGVLLVSISVMVIDGAAADTVGIDIELDFSSQSGQMPWSQWNHICVVQGSGEAGSSSMLIRAFLNGLASKENMVTLPPLVSFSGAAVDAADSRMDFEMSFGLEAAALDTGLPEVCLEIASIVILDRAMQSSDIQSLVAVGPTYKSGSFVNYERTPLYRPQLSSVDMSVCPPAVWRGLVQSASIPPNEKMKTRTFGLMADVNTMSVSLGLMEPCRIVLAVSNEWMLPRSRENEWTPIGNQSAPDPVIGCVLATSSVVPTGLFRIGRVYIWPMRRAPDFAALLDTSSIAALVSQLVDAAQSSQTLNLIVKFLASFLAAAPQFRVKFGLSSELSIILSSIRRKLRQQPALMDSCLSVRLLSLSGSTLGCQQGTPCQWNDFVVTDAVFFADLISDFDLWCSFPTEIFSSALHAMKIAFYTTVGSKARYFSSNKMQLQNSRVVRSILRGLLDVTFSITLDFISIVCSFLLHHFVPTDRLCRTCATEDDFEALSAALCLSARLAFETPCRTDSSGNKQFEKNYIVDFNSRCHSVAAALSSLLLEIASSLEHRFGVLCGDTNEANSSYSHSPSGRTLIYPESPQSAVGDLQSAFESESNLVQLRISDDSPGASGKRHDRRSSRSHADMAYQQSTLSVENVLRSSRLMLCAFPAGYGVALLYMASVHIFSCTNAFFARSVATSLVLYLSTVHVLLPSDAERGDLRKELHWLAPFLADAVLNLVSKPFAFNDDEKKFATSKLSYLNLKGFLPFMIPSQLSLDMKVMYPFQSKETVLRFGPQVADASSWAGQLLGGYMDLMLGGAGYFQSCVSQLCDGWSFEDVEPIFIYNTAAEPREGFAAAFECVSRLLGGNSLHTGDSNDIVACCLGVASCQQIHTNSMALQADSPLQLDFVNAIFEFIMRTVSSTSVASIIFSNQTDRILMSCMSCPAGPCTLSYGDVFEEKVVSELSAESNAATSVCVSALCILMSLWTRSAAFQRTMVSEPGLLKLKEFVASIVSLFFASSRARLLEVIFLDSLKRAALAEGWRDDAQSTISVLFVDSKLYKDVLQTFNELDGKSVFFSNLLLYRSGGSIIGRLCLQLLTSIGDSFFLSSLPVNWIFRDSENAKTSFSTLRRVYGDCNDAFFDAFEGAMLAPPMLSALNKVPLSFQVPLSMLLNSAVRRRIVATASARLDCWTRVAGGGISTGRLYERQADFTDDWDRALMCVSRLSTVVFSITILETELSKKMTGMEINFESRVQLPIRSMLTTLRSLNELRVLITEAGMDNGLGDNATTSEPVQIFAPSISGISSSVSNLFRRKSAAEPRGENVLTENKSLGGMMGNLLKQGIKNISTVSDGFIGRRHHKIMLGAATFEEVVRNAIMRLRYSFLYLLEFHRHTPVVLCKLLPELNAAHDLLILWDVPGITAISEQATAAAPSKNSQGDTVAFLASCLGIFLYIFCLKQDPICSTMTAITWGKLLSDAESGQIAMSLRSLLIVDVVSPNDSTAKMKLNFLNFESVGFSRLVRIAAAHKDSVVSAPDESKMSQETVSQFAEDIAIFIDWFASTPESLRESFRIQLSKVAKPFVKTSKILSDKAIKQHLTALASASSRRPELELRAPTVDSRLDVCRRVASDQLFEQTSSLNRRISESNQLLEARALLLMRHLSPRMILLAKTAWQLQDGVQHNSECDALNFPPSNFVSYSTRPQREHVLLLCEKCRSSGGDGAVLPWVSLVAMYLSPPCVEPSALQNQFQLPRVLEGIQICDSCSVENICIAMPSRPSTDAVAVGIVISNSHSSFNVEGNTMKAPRHYRLSYPMLCGEWALDFSESHLRMRRSIRRSSLTILACEELSEKLSAFVVAGSLPLPDLIELPVSAKPNVTTDTGLQFNTFASARSFDQNEFWIQELSTKTNIYNSPARSFTVKDWEVLEAGSTTQHRTGIGTYDNFDTSTDHMVPSDILLPPATTSSFADAIAAEDGPDSENELAIPTESRSSPIDIEGFTGSLESSLVDPKIREDNEFGIATTTVTDTYITATEELAANLDRVDSGIRTSNSTDAHGLAEHDIPVLCPGEACGQTFVCNLVAAMDYRPSKCILSRKRMYVYGCFIDSNGMLRYIHKLGQSKSRPAVSPAVCNGGSAAPISLVVPSVKTLSSSLMSAIIEMLHFEAAPSGGGDFMISFRDIMGLHRRRYLLAHKGVEIFLVSGRSLFLAFPSSSLRNAFCTEVLKHCPHISALDICISAESADDIFQTTPLGLTPLAAYWYHRQRQLSRSPMTGAGILSATAIAAPLHVVSLQAATDRWVAGDMTNFEYIMTLNTYSGRTFNDWTQYPVFPWVLKDYSSSMLNLDDASVYRDLSKPMGALHEVREREARKKYDILEHQAREPSDKCMEQLVDGTDGNMPLAMMPFHYGTNYSSAAAVLHYMVRLQPFAAHAVAFQGGKKFDKPDRIFQSIERAWLSASGGLTNDPLTRTGNLQDVKELIPEFYYLPDFLVNVNGYTFGENSDGRWIGDVDLPPWAHGSPVEFIRLHRLALESPFVTARLHKWIDLIFGYKQRGSKAIKACNTFQFISYEGSIDVDSLGTQAERDVCLQQIREFGQIPAQVFQSPHPASKAAKASAANSFASSAEGSSGVINSTKPLMDALISTDAFEPPVQFTNSVSESVEIQRQLYSYDCKDFRTSRADASIAHFSGSIVAVSIAQGAEAALIAASDTFSGSAEKFVPTDELSMGPPVSRLCIQSYVVLCPDSAIFLPFYDVMASGRPDHAVRERSEINLSGTGIGVSHGIMAAWGYSDCTFKVFFNSFGSLNGSKSSDKTNRHELVSSREWEFVRSINYPNITVSCAACSNSGRLLMTGHAHYSAIQKWRVYPTMLGNSDKLKKMSTAAVSAHLDCNIVLVESIPCSAHQGCIDSIAISVCNGIVVTACRAGTVVLWSLDSLEQTKIFPNATIIENPAFCCNSAHVIVSSVVIETTTGYIYFSIGPDVIVTDVNGRVLGCIHPTDVHNSTTVTCISPTTGLGMTSLLTKASGSLFSVIIGYSCGEVRTWQAASCNLTDSGTDRAHNGNGKLQSVIVHCCSTVQLPCKLAAQSLAIPRPRRSRGSFPMTSENSDLIDVFISLSDGSVHVLKLNSELTFLHK